MLSPRLTLAAALLTLVAACDDRSPVAPASTLGPVAPSRDIGIETTPLGGPWARVVEGTTGPGALYAIHVPREWNGDAVVYAHGFRDAWSPVDLRDQDGLFDMRDRLGALGYAVAYSSYSANGFAIADGALRTHQLSGLLASTLGRQPTRTFLAGHSLGAAVALTLVERHPEQYAGALLMCGMVGGSRMQTDYLGHVRALADVYFRGRFQGDALSFPAGQVVTLAQTVAAVQSNPLGLFALASTMQTPLPYVPVGSPTDPSSPAFQTLVGSLYAALNFHSRGIENIRELTHGMSPFGNADTRYVLGTSVLGAPFAPTLGALIAASDAGVTRYAMDRSAELYLDHNFTPTGNLRVPVLTVHNAWNAGTRRRRAPPRCSRSARCRPTGTARSPPRSRCRV
jgi:pimeloyl-ACP methyl ester carboxylesterase